MDFVTIEFDRQEKAWLLVDPGTEPHADEDFFVAADISLFRWEALDIMQRYCFKVMYDGYDDVCGLRFLGVEARWGEYVAATQDQLVLGNPL